MLNNLLESALTQISAHPEILIIVGGGIWFFRTQIKHYTVPVIFLGSSLTLIGAFLLYHLKDIIIFENVQSFEDIATVWKIILACLGAIVVGLLLVFVAIRKSGRDSR